jgi:hypothetical protein
VRGHRRACTGLPLAIHLVGHPGKTHGTLGSSVTPALSWINTPVFPVAWLFPRLWAPAQPAACSMRVFDAECCAETGQDTL